MKQSKGITLVALVLTIIVLLILAGVTINSILGERGIFSAAQSATEKAKISEYLEKIELARVEVASQNLGEVLLENIIVQLYKDEVVPNGNITIVEDYAVMVTPEEYTFIITADKAEHMPNGTIEVPGDINDYIGSGKVEIKQTPNAEIYTKESVIIEITSQVEYQKVQYSLDNGKTYKDYINPFEVYKNQTIYILLRNALGKQGTVYMHEIGNIDTEAPIITKVETTPTSITFSAKDNLSGIVGYQITQNSEEPSQYDEIENTLNVENKTVNVANQNTTYYVWVKDDVGNVSAYSTAKTGTQPVTSITIAPTNATLKPEETLNLIATINPTNAFNKEISWISENANIVKVGTATQNENGTVSVEVTALAEGTTTITAKSEHGENGEDVTDVCTIIVKKPINYGTSIQSNYGTLYTTNYPSGFTVYDDYDNNYNGNYNRAGALLSDGNEKWLGKVSFSAGNNQVNFSENISNRWVGFFFLASAYSTSIYIGDLKLVFNDGRALTLVEAVSEGLVEPLVVCSSVSSNSAAYLWGNFFNLVSGGSCNSGNYPKGILKFKVKEGARLTGVSFYSNKSSIGGEGFNTGICYEGYEVSISPIE